MWTIYLLAGIGGIPTNGSNQFPQWLQGKWAESVEACSDYESTRTLRIGKDEIGHYEGSDKLVTVISDYVINEGNTRGRILRSRLSYHWADGPEPDREVLFVLSSGNLFLIEDGVSREKSIPYSQCIG